MERNNIVDRVAQLRDLLGVVAHDLRSPVSLIDMTAQFLLEADPPVERRRELLLATRRAAARMEHLVGDLLDAVRLDSTGLRMEPGEVDVRAVLRAADEGYRLLADKKGVELCIVPLEAALYAHGDEARINQAIGNLLGNAVKFTGAGGKVSLFVAESAGEVTFTVSDTGPGIPASEVEHVTDRFWQARMSDRRGVGLGLAIVKGIVEAHASRLRVESTVGVGSSFSFTLPRCAVPVRTGVETIAAA